MKKLAITQNTCNQSDEATRGGAGWGGTRGSWCESHGATRLQALSAVIKPLAKIIETLEAALNDYQTQVADELRIPLHVLNVIVLFFFSFPDELQSETVDMFSRCLQK